MTYWVVREGSELEHYGVLGMKWGVRKDKQSSSTSPTSKNQNGSSEKKDSKSKDLIDKGKQLVKENWPLAVIAAVLPGVSLPMLLAGKAAIEAYKFKKVRDINMNMNEIKHYGVKGMKWGIMTKLLRSSSNPSLKKQNPKKNRNRRKKIINGTAFFGIELLDAMLSYGQPLPIQLINSGITYLSLNSLYNRKVSELMEESSHIKHSYDEFKHYGILGMKLGVRRTPEQLGHRTIKAGTKMYRTTASNDESGKTGSTYVTYLPPDRDMYRGAWANTIRANAGLKKGDPLYETEYVLKEDLNIPSREEQTEVVNKLKEKNGGKALKQYVDRIISSLIIDEQTYIAYERLNDKTSSDAELKKKYKKALSDVTENVLKDYKNMNPDQFFRTVTSRFGTDTISREEVIKELSKRGYNAMVDQASIGGGTRNREGVDSMIIFDRNATLETKKTKKISKVGENLANARYMNWYKAANNPRYRNQPW